MYDGKLPILDTRQSLVLSDNSAMFVYHQTEENNTTRPISLCFHAVPTRLSLDKIKSKNSSAFLAMIFLVSFLEMLSTFRVYWLNNRYSEDKDRI